jgi:hypothetical protein
MKNIYRILDEKPDGKRQNGRPRRGWEVKSKLDPK